MVDGRVFALRNRSEEAEKGKPLVLAAVAFVMEPFTFKHWLLRLVPRFRLWVSNITKPVHDGSDDEVCSSPDAKMERHCLLSIAAHDTHASHT